MGCDNVGQQAPLLAVVSSTVHNVAYVGAIAVSLFGARGGGGRPRPPLCGDFRICACASMRKPLYALQKGDDTAHGMHMSCPRTVRCTPHGALHPHTSLPPTTTIPPPLPPTITCLRCLLAFK